MTETPPITVETLLAQTDWLRALARQLVRDRDRAEDLFQETVLASLRDQGAVRGPLRPWLSRVARNLAARSSRGEARRTRRESAVAQPNSQVGAQDRIRMQRTVIDAVQGLQEPYLTPVLLRFFEDLPPREIAKRLDVPVETVKTRLRRGLQTLRGTLDQEFGGREPWLVAILPALEFGTKTRLATSAVGGASGTALAWSIPSTAVLSAVALLIVGMVAFLLSQQSTGNAAAVAQTADANMVQQPEGSAGPLAKQPERRALLSTPDRSPAQKTDTVRVKIVEKATGKPVAGQIVRYMREHPRDDKLAQQMDQDHHRTLNGTLEWAEFLRRYTKSTTSDKSGFVQVPCPDSSSTDIVVIDGQLEGRTRLQAKQEHKEYILELRPIVTTEVEVVDAAGKPASGVPIALFDGRRPRFTTLTRTGRATLRLYFMYEEARQTPRHIGILWPVFESKSVDLGRLSGPVRLRLPPNGSITITVVDENAEFLRGAGYVELFELDDSATNRRGLTTGKLLRQKRVGPPSRSESTPRMGRSLATARLQNGVARFPHVGLGRRFGVQVKTNHRSEPIQSTIHGPTFPGATAKATVRAGTRKRSVAFRVLAPDGEVLRKQAMGVLLRSQMGGSNSSMSRVMVTDSEGLLCLTLQDEWIPRSRRTLVLWLKPKGQGKRDLTATACIDLGRPFNFGATRLADVKLSPAPVVVAGTVVDERGVPISGARVKLQRLRRRQVGRIREESVRGIEPVQTGKDGRFALLGYQSGGEIRIRASKPGHTLLKPLDTRPGTTGLIIQLPAAGSLRGSLAAGLPVDQLAAKLSMQFGPRTVHTLQIEPKTRGFSIRDIPPGSYSFQVQSSGAGTLFESPVVIVAGRTTRPAALQGIQLTARVRQLRITVTDQDRRPLARQTVMQRTGDTSWIGIETDEKGVAIVLAPPEGTDLRVGHGSYRPVDLKRVQSDQTVVLQKKIRVTLRIAGRMPKDIKLKVFSRPTIIKSPHQALTRSVEVTSRGGIYYATLEFSAPGDHQLHPSFSGRTPGFPSASWAGSRARVFSPGKISVKDTSEPQQFELKIDGVQLTQALAEYRAWIEKNRERQRRR